VFISLIDSLSLDNRSLDERTEWLSFIAQVKELVPAAEDVNEVFADFANPFQLVTELSGIARKDWKIVPCSSGGSYTSVMQAFQQKAGQLLPNNKGLASMGYGLAGAIGVATAWPATTTVLIEGDGGFAQNLSELGTVAKQNLNLKIFLSNNGGYASIRSSQRAVFEGNYIGCDTETGLGFPEWRDLFAAYGIPSLEVSGSLLDDQEALRLIESPGPAAIISKVHKDQPFLPKLTSRIYPDGTMKSNPLHLMSPPLHPDLADVVLRYLPEELRYAE
jgi:acetolactate synthase-1/2/3 large subunit